MNSFFRKLTYLFLVIAATGVFFSVEAKVGEAKLSQSNELALESVLESFCHSQEEYMKDHRPHKPKTAIQGPAPSVPLTGGAFLTGVAGERSPLEFIKYIQILSVSSMSFGSTEMEAEFYRKLERDRARFIEGFWKSAKMLKLEKKSLVRAIQKHLKNSNDQELEKLTSTCSLSVGDRGTIFRELGLD